MQTQALGRSLEPGLWPSTATSPWCPRGQDALVKVSELEELGARREDTFPHCAEIDEHSDIILNPDDRAEAVLVVVHPIL